MIYAIVALSILTLAQSVAIVLLWRRVHTNITLRLGPDIYTVDRAVHRAVDAVAARLSADPSHGRAR
jgi:hypothetical protein